MSHRPPRCGGICSIIARAIFTNLKPRSSSRHCQVDNALFIPRRFDCVCITRLVQFHSHIVGIEPGLRLIETVVVQGVRAKLVFPGSFMIEDLTVELTRSVDSAIASQPSRS